MLWLALHVFGVMSGISAGGFFLKKCGATSVVIKQNPGAAEVYMVCA